MPMLVRVDDCQLDSGREGPAHHLHDNRIRPARHHRGTPRTVPTGSDTTTATAGAPRGGCRMGRGGSWGAGVSTTVQPRSAANLRQSCTRRAPRPVPSAAAEIRAQVAADRNPHPLTSRFLLHPEGKSVTHELHRSRGAILVKGNDVTFGWVKGHSGDAMNDLVDAPAVAAIPR